MSALKLVDKITAKEYFEKVYRDNLKRIYEYKKLYKELENKLNKIVPKNLIQEKILIEIEILTKKYNKF